MVHLLASLPDSYDMRGRDCSTTADRDREAFELLREEQKLREREEADDGKKVLVTQGNPNPKFTASSLCTPECVVCPQAEIGQWSRATLSGKSVKFVTTGCEFLNDKNEVTAFATKQGSLYYLEVCRNSAFTVESRGKQRLWHRRYGHLNAESLKKLVKKKLVNQLYYDVSGGVGIHESCIGGKQCKDSFKPSTTKTSDPLELAHSDVCGRMGKKSIGGAEYFLTLVDDKTHYTWVYPLKTKNRCTTSSGNGKRRLRPGLGNVSTLFEPTTTASTPPKSYRHTSRPAGSDMN